MVSVDAGAQRLEGLARHFHERELEHAPEQVGLLIHEDAEMRLLVNRLRPLRGRDAVVEMFSRVRETSIYSAKVEQMQWLDERTLLISANARYPLEDGGLATSRVWWLDEFLDGRLRRVRAFDVEAEALAAYRADHTMSERLPVSKRFSLVPDLV
jgi:hypothetical protein